jgi:hypothetical protein
VHRVIVGEYKFGRPLARSLAWQTFRDIYFRLGPPPLNLMLAWLIAKTVFDPELVKGFLTCHGVLLLRWARALVAAGVSVSLAGVLVACFDEG